MRVLLTNHHLAERAGSELYTLELAMALKELGHQVGVFTFIMGPVAQALRERGVAVFGVSDEERIRHFAPDVLHVHHAPCLYYLAGLGLSCPAIFSSLGFISPLEAPPVYWEGVVEGLAVSEEVLARLRSSRFGAAVPLRIFRNWVDDRMLQPKTLTWRGEIRRLAVVTNHLDDTLREQLGRLAASRHGFEWVHFGLPANSVQVTPELLEPFDAVVSIGRSVLLAGAIGKPCLLYDVHGCDGWLDAETLPQLATRNFSGRLRGLRPGFEELEHLLLEQARRVDVDAVRTRVLEDFCLTVRAREASALYEAARQTGLALGPASQGEYLPVGRAYADAVTGATLWREQHRVAETGRLQERQEKEALSLRLTESERRQEMLLQEAAQKSSHLQVLQDEVEHLRRRLETVQGSLSQAHGQLEQAQEQLRSAHAAHQSAQSLLLERDARLMSIESSLAWRAVNRLRSTKDRLVPHGSRRRGLYNAGLTLIKRQS
jgi:hypothetical protein